VEFEEIKENIVIDYSGQEFRVGDKVKFVVEILDGYEEYWVGHVKKITEFTADADDDGVWYGIEPTVIIEYADGNIVSNTTYNTYQDRINTNVFVCEELEII
jgi:hypothetical protein